MPRKKIKIALLTAGVVAGYGSGIASYAHCCGAHRASFEAHVAKVCVDAAKAPATGALDSANDAP